MRHLGFKDMRRLGSTTGVAALLPGHCKEVPENIVCFPCLEYKILSVIIQKQRRKNYVFDMPYVLLQQQQQQNKL